MPWYNGDYPPSYKNQPVYIRDKATEIANAILEESGDEGIAIATGLKKRENILMNIQKKLKLEGSRFLTFHSGLKFQKHSRQWKLNIAVILIRKLAEPGNCKVVNYQQ